MDKLSLQAEILAQKIRHLIITSSGRTSDDASIQEYYQAFCTALREEVMINWTATLKSIEEKKTRIGYFVSMEYLPGRLTGNNLTNIGAIDLVKTVLAKMGRDFNELISCEPDPGLGNGGLGRLASCFLDSLATLQYPTRAYGLRYQYGIFEQEIWGGHQIERPDCWLLNVDPWEQRRDTHAVSVRYRGVVTSATNRHGEEIDLLEGSEDVRALPYDVPIIGYSGTGDFSVLTLRLWSTKESPRNFQLQCYNAGFLGQASENTSLTDVLYPNDYTDVGKRIRLKQEFLLVSASLDDILQRHLRIHGTINNFREQVRIQLNETHAALMVPELIRTLTKNYDYTWEEAVETCLEVCSYTNHTILKEALEEWSSSQLRELLPRQYRIIERLNYDFCEKIRSRFPKDEEKVRRVSIIEENQVRMAHLAIAGSHKINGVARLHSEILKTRIFKDLYDLTPEKFTNVTNGVTQRRWLCHANPMLTNFISERIGTEWICDFRQLSKLAPFASDKKSQEEFLRIKRENKQRLFDLLLKENPLRDKTGKPIPQPPLPETTALIDVQIKRFHEYKRQLLNALYLIMLYQELKENPDSHSIVRLSLFAGKAAPGYVRSKQILLLISAISRTIAQDPVVKEKLTVIFIENYNVSKAELIIPAADLSEQISTAGWEASGTGNMKLSMNGALTIGTDDGANIEMREAVTDTWWPFKFGASAAHNLKPYKSWDIYLQDESIRRVVDSLKEGPFAETEEEIEAFSALHLSLLEGDGKEAPDRYRVLQDLRAYYETQKKVETLYQQPHKWAETAIHNIAAMGPFSTDESIRHYAEDIWGLERCPPNPEILNRVRTEYAEHDRCKITL